MLVPRRSRTRSPSLKGASRPPLRPANTAPNCPIPDKDLIRTFLTVFFPSTFPFKGLSRKSVATASRELDEPSGISSESNLIERHPKRSAHGCTQLLGSP